MRTVRSIRRSSSDRGAIGEMAPVGERAISSGAWRDTKCKRDTYKVSLLIWKDCVIASDNSSL